MTSIGRRSSLRIRNARQRNRTRIRSAMKETKGSLGAVEATRLGL